MQGELGARGARRNIRGAHIGRLAETEAEATHVLDKRRPVVEIAVVGIEYGGAVKNVFAMAGGIADGLGLGDNAKAALVTRGLAEIIRLGDAMGARRETLMGLAGVGDLILTCTDDQSRTRRMGLGLAAGNFNGDDVDLILDRCPLRLDPLHLDCRLATDLGQLAQLVFMVGPSRCKQALLGFERSHEFRQVGFRVGRHLGGAYALNVPSHSFSCGLPALGTAIVRWMLGVVQSTP